MHSRYGYSMTKEDILNLTVKDFKDRVGDALELERQFKGEGKGRIVKEDFEKIKEAAIKKGLPIPKRQAYIRN